MAQIEREGLEQICLIYVSIESQLKDLNVTNDLAERCVKDVQEYYGSHKTRHI